MSQTWTFGLECDASNAVTTPTSLHFSRVFRSSFQCIIIDIIKHFVLPPIGVQLFNCMKCFRLSSRCFSPVGESHAQPRHIFIILASCLVPMWTWWCSRSPSADFPSHCNCNPSASCTFLSVFRAFTCRACCGFGSRSTLIDAEMPTLELVGARRR